MRGSLGLYSRAYLKSGNSEATFWIFSVSTWRCVRLLIRTTNPGAPVAAKINLQLILPSNTKLQNYSFPVDLHSGDTVLNLGLTGDDWPNAHANPVAWKLDFVAADGHVLATEKSYLWEKPADK